MCLVCSRLLSLVTFKWIILLIIGNLYLGYVRCLRMEVMRVPAHAFAGESAVLECIYDLEGDKLYSVKWYKDGKEFFRFQPGDDVPAVHFDENGPPVDLVNSTDSKVILRNLPLTASGNYRCEVSGEAPAFEMIADHGFMLVVAVPEIGPHITGRKSRYQIGEIANLTCSIVDAHPAAKLQWFINGEPADINDLNGPIHFISDRGLTTTILNLKFKVRAKHFKKGDMKIKCLAMIGNVFARSNEESVEGERQQKGAVLESRNAVLLNNISRADRVQASPGATKPLSAESTTNLVSSRASSIYLCTSAMLHLLILTTTISYMR